ncbi:MAG: ATP-grasp domain-containing protein, partial [Candidatus Saccharibacteria bacterium]|nr:ATP-grasp domain-containing protein [Candidatus Saccharibacteria bacterium]
MIAIEEISERELIDTAREIVRIMKFRGWKNIRKLYHPGPSYFLAERPDGKTLRLLSSLPPTTSALSYQLAHNKIATYEILKTAKIKQPETVLVRDEENLKSLLERHSKLIIKPHNGAHGQKVFANISSVEAAKTARTEIERENRGSGDDAIAIAQEMIPGDNPEIRVVCIDYNFVVAFERVPASVTGDGKHSVAELIEIENTTIRGEAYLSNLSKINLAEALDYLGEKSEIILEKDKRMRVHPTCNIGQGGTARVV